MATQRDTNFRLRACERCGGDAYLDMADDPEWRCLQCARPVPQMTTVPRTPLAFAPKAA